MEKVSVDIRNLPDRFGELLARTEPGHEIIVTEGGQPKAVLTPLSAVEPAERQQWEEVMVSFLGQPKTIRVLAKPASSAAKPRVPGLGQGTMTILPGFDDPLPDEFWLGES